jgi:hypothetical protein
MATLVLSALGTAVGGPLGGAIGGLLGNQIDHAVFGGPRREGPRLKELSVSTSSYGTPIARHHGRVRTAGTIVWSTDLVERKQKSGGGKGQPSVTNYSYSVSFAVALSSRPVAAVGRIWADGSLLRGAAGDLKSGGAFRLYTGEGDQPLDPLLASAEPNSPAFRGLAYCVFEALELTDFGNRIPALTFEVIADDHSVTIASLLEPLAQQPTIDRTLDGLQGFSNDGGALADTLAAIDQLYPLACDAGGDSLSLGSADRIPDAPPILPEATAADGDESFAAATGQQSRRQAEASDIPDALRYYDIARDYQPGMQRADGRARPGRSQVIEFPGVLQAADARSLTNAAAARAGWSRETIAWRMAELDPAIAPGSVVRVPNRDGLWRIDSWEWRDQGIELELTRLPRGPARQPAADPGAALPAPDLAVTSTQLLAYEMPWDGNGSSETRATFAAASSLAAGWRGAALYVQQGSDLLPLGPSGSQRSIIGTTVTHLPPSSPLLLDRMSSLEVDLASPDFALDSADVAALGNGANMALVGTELLQFVRAERLGDTRWRLTGLLRGRGGTEAQAQPGGAAGAGFVLLDGAPVALDSARLDPAGATLAAIGLADPQPVYAPLANAGIARQPLSPVHGTVGEHADGSLSLAWCRRARGSWLWFDEIEVPLNEQAELYVVGLGDSDAPELRWETETSTLQFDAATWAALRSAHAGKPIWVRQVGTAALSPPLLLTTIA